MTKTKDSSFKTITIDGPSSSGKSTVAKLVAKTLGFYYLDTGSLYRAIGLKYKMLKKPKLETEKQIQNFLSKVDLKVKYYGGTQHTYIDGVEITSKIHNEEIGTLCSKISPIPQIRAVVMRIQRSVASKHNIVCDGRDVGLNVLPDAKFKIFLTASAQARAQRRFKEYFGTPKQRSYEELLKDIVDRDNRDIHREHGAMVPAKDAYILDTSEMTIDEVVDTIVNFVKKG